MEDEFVSPMEPEYIGPHFDEPEPEVTHYDLAIGPPPYVLRMRQYNELMDQIHELQNRASDLARSIGCRPPEQESWFFGSRPNYSPVVVEPSRNPRGRVRPG